MNRKLNIIYAAPNRRRERRNTMKLKKLASLALAGALTLGLLPAFSSPALAADGGTSTYTLTIPSTLSVANSGWNATDGISATGTLADRKKLTVTASSDGEFALVNQSDNTQKVGYNLATASTDTKATTSWTFDSLSSTATKKDMGIIVENYDDKPAGTYTDTVTFTAKVESAVPTLATAFENGAVIVINFKYQGSAASATLTNDNGTFKYTAGSGYLWNYQHALNYQDLVIARNEDGKLVVRAADQLTYGYNGNDKNYDMMLKMVFDPATNIYEQSVSRASWDTYMTDAEWFNEYAFTSITINGTDITSTLTKGSQIVVVN